MSLHYGKKCIETVKRNVNEVEYIDVLILWGITEEMGHSQVLSGKRFIP